MADNFKNVGTVIGGDGDPANGDGLCTNLSLFPINSVYVNNSTGKVFTRDAANGVAADWVSQSGGSSYLVYTALLNQDGTDAPVATVLQNTLGGTIIWTRNGAGNYTGTLSGAFTVNKTFLLVGIQVDDGSAIVLKPNNVNTVSILSYAAGSTEDSLLIGQSIEIRVYP